MVWAELSPARTLRMCSARRRSGLVPLARQSYGGASALDCPVGPRQAIEACDLARRSLYAAHAAMADGAASGIVARLYVVT